MSGTWYGSDFSDSRDTMIIFSASRDPLRVPTTPKTNPEVNITKLQTFARLYT